MKSEKLHEFCMHHAISDVLADYPENKTPQEIIEMIENDDMEEIMVCEEFEDYDNWSVANLINERADVFAVIITDWEKIK